MDDVTFNIGSLVGFYCEAAVVVFSRSCELQGADREVGSNMSR